MSYRFMTLITFLSITMNFVTGHTADVRADIEDQAFLKMAEYFTNDEINPRIPKQKDVLTNKCSSDNCMEFSDITLDAMEEVLSTQSFLLEPSLLIAKIKQVKLAFKNDLPALIQLYALLYRYSISIEDVDWEDEILVLAQYKLQKNKLTRKDVTSLYAHRNYLVLNGWESLFQLMEREHSDLINPIFFTEKPATNVELAYSLLHKLPALKDYKSGRYANVPRVFMFCRTDRSFPCRMVMKDKNNNFHQTASGAIWNQPSLGYSRHKKNYNERNGNTPSGVLRIDGVMSDADQTTVFGKFRRMILNFVALTENETDTKLLIPADHAESTWWQEASVSRDIGRGLLRIHGTGLRSSTSKNYFPLVPTSGCIAQRENVYGKVEYIDQRIILDEMMRAQGLEPNYENEVKIRGLIYIMNLDSKKSAVGEADLKELGVPL